jgi:hypothetical protein
VSLSLAFTADADRDLSGLGFWVLGFWVLGFGFRVLGFWVFGFGF